MMKNWITKGFKIALFMVFFFAFFGYVTMELWNWLMPSIFGLTAINFWQALGLLFLSKLIFGGFPGKGRGGSWGKGNWKNKMRDKFENMSDQDKEKLKARWEGYCGPWKYDKKSQDNTAEAISSSDVQDVEKKS
ncbi:MAG: hypothetical protein RIC15_02505 [Vicingaceae bacterium]